MPKRTEDYNEMISLKLRQETGFAKTYIQLLIEEEDFSPQEALAEIAKKMGQKEFAEHIGIPKQRVTELISNTRKLKFVTLQNLLKPFGLQAKIVLEDVA